MVQRNQLFLSRSDRNNADSMSQLHIFKHYNDDIVKTYDIILKAAQNLTDPAVFNFSMRRKPEFNWEKRTPKIKTGVEIPAWGDRGIYPPHEDRFEEKGPFWVLDTCSEPFSTAEGQHDSTCHDLSLPLASPAGRDAVTSLSKNKMSCIKLKLKVLIQTWSMPPGLNMIVERASRLWPSSSMPLMLAWLPGNRTWAPVRLARNTRSGSEHKHELGY